MNSENLTEREEKILESIVQQFVLTGMPVGSRTLSKSKLENLSPASIRNVMSDLEEKGYLGHPHTSAGRIPTTKGYRHYVDYLLSLSKLTDKEKEIIKDNISHLKGDIDLILDRTVQVLARISMQLSVILSPKFEDGLLEKMDIVQLSSEKFLIVLTIKDGIARTIILEVHHEIKPESIHKVVYVLNERLSGLKLREIKKSFSNRVRDIMYEDTGLIRLFVDSADKLFDFERFSDVKYTGTINIINNPEFANINKFTALIELLEQKNIIIHMMENRYDPPRLKVTIGNENEEKLVQDCSIITAPYRVGKVEGLVGIIGPTRMSYNHLIPLVDYTAKYVTHVFKEK